MPMRVVRLSWAVVRRRWREVLLIVLVLGAAVVIPVALHMKSEDDARREDQLCAAIPNAAAAGADALIDTAIVQARKRKAPESEIRRLRTVGALYAGHARYLVLHRYLPFCQQVRDPLAPPPKETSP